MSDRSRDAIIAAIAHGSVASNESGSKTAAITLRAGLDRLDVLTNGERHLLGDWLDRIIQSADRVGDDEEASLD